jgi:hypothetical protein
MRSSGRFAARVAALVAVGVIGVGCGGGTAPRPTAATRPATKETCPAPVLPTNTGFQLVDRNLVGFGPTTLGIDEQYAGDGTTMQVVSGGYFDEITEPYDTLQVVGNLPVRGADAEVLAGPYQGTTVHIALWREPGVAVPCDAHAIVATGVTEEQFFGMITTLS